MNRVSRVNREFQVRSVEMKERMKRVKMFLVVLGALTAFGASHTESEARDDAD